MTIKHEVITLTSEKEYLGLKDPASKKILEQGDVVTVCRSKGGPAVFLTSNLSTYENKCPFCGELLSMEELPKPVASPTRSKNKKERAKVEPPYASTIEEDRRLRGGFASLGVGALVLIAFLCIASLWAFFAFTGRGTPTASYPTQKVSPTQRTSPTQRAISTPRPRPTATKKTTSSSNNSQSSAQQTKEYAEISCADIYYVNLRRTPGYSGKDDSVDSIYEVPCGELMELLGPTEKADGLTWWKVSWRGYTGWVADHTGRGKIILDFNP